MLDRQLFRDINLLKRGLLCAFNVTLGAFAFRYQRTSCVGNAAQHALKIAYLQIRQNFTISFAVIKLTSNQNFWLLAVTAIIFYVKSVHIFSVLWSNHYDFLFVKCDN